MHGRRACVVVNPQKMASIPGETPVTHGQLQVYVEGIIQVWTAKVNEMEQKMQYLHDQAAPCEEKYQRILNDATAKFQEIDGTNKQKWEATETLFQQAQEKMLALDKVQQDSTGMAQAEMQRMRNESQQSIEWIKGMDGKLSKWAADFTAQHGGDTKAGRPKQFGLVNTKDCQVSKLHEKVTKEEFIHWRTCVELYVEAISDWKGGSLLLSRLRHHKKEVDADGLYEIIKKINQEEGEDTIFTLGWDGSPSRRLMSSMVSYGPGCQSVQRQNAMKSQTEMALKSSG